MQLPDARSYADSETNIITQEILKELPENTGCNTLALPDGNVLVVIPVENLTQQKRIVTGIILRETAPGFHRVLQLFLDNLKQAQINAEQARQLQSDTPQVSINHGELTWFRALVDNLAFHESNHNLSPSAHHALMSLKDLIQAESLTVVLNKQDKTTSSENYGKIFNLGSAKVDEKLVADLFQMAGPNSICQSYINNRVSSAEGTFSRDIRSIVIIPALCRNRCFGWLIAVNKQEAPENESQESHLPSQFRGHFDSKAALLMELAANALATHAHNIQIFRDQQKILVGTVRTLVNALDTKDQYTCGHSDRVAQIAKAIATQHGLSGEECHRIYLAGLLHDIGKIGVRDEVLSKPGILTKEEFEEIKMHPVLGYEILKHLDQLQHVLPGVLFHHEAWDGTGYPHGLDEEEIPLAARILAVADAYDAMTSNRSYRMGMPKEKAEQTLRNGQSKQWDPQIVDAFFEILDKVHRIISGKSSSFNLPTLNSEYVFEDEIDAEDNIQSAVFTLSGIHSEP